MTQPVKRWRLAPVGVALFGVVSLWGIGMGLLGEKPLEKEIVEMDEGQPMRLEAGQPVERQIAGGEKHSYLQRLEAGQYLRVAAEQRGIDVLLRLYGADGAPITEVDSPGGDHGFERISEVAVVAGDYRIEVAGTEGAKPGTYEIRIEELRAATDRDRRLVGAERVFVEGDRLRRDKQLDEALALYRQALEVWETEGGPGDQARAFYRIGWVLDGLDRWKEAEGFFDRAVEASRQAGDRVVEAIVLNRRGTLLRLLGRYEESRVSHEQALTAFRANRNPNGEKDALNNLGNVHFWAGRIQAAVEAYEAALTLARGLGDRTAESTILVNVGEVYLSQGKLPEARDGFEDALEIARELGNDAKVSQALTDLGDVETREGRFLQAREALGRALEIQRRLQDRYGEAITLNFLGTVLLKSGDPDRAREHYERALVLFRELGDIQSEATVVVNLGRLEENQQDFELASAHYGESRKLFERLQDRQGLAMAHYGGARALAEQGDLADAREMLEVSLDSVESLREETQSLSMRTSYFASKQHYWDLYIDILMGLHEQNPSGGFAALGLQAAERRRFRGLLDALAETRVDIRQGIDPAFLDEERSLQQRLDRVERKRLEVLENGGDTEQAEALERESRDLLRQSDLVRSRIREKNPRFADLLQPETVSLKQIQARLLGHDDLLLVYSLGEERSFVWTVSRGSFAVRTLEGRERIEASAERFHELLTRSSRRAKSLRDEAAADLAELVLVPVADRTANFTRLLIVADGALQKIPFATLPLSGEGGKRRAIERHEIVLLPSASVLATLRRETKGKSLRINDPWVAVLADPVFRADDPRVGAPKAGKDPVVAARPSSLRASMRDLGLSGLDRLPHTRREAEAIEKWVKRPEDRFIALDFEADRRLITGGRLRDFRVLHFATHSIINDRQPELSGLVLSLVGPDGRPQEGFLRLHEIYNLDLKADLVVLSACQTGTGREIRGEGLAGIVRGFMHAGVPGVIVSLWDVDDAATAELMSRFYKYLFEHGQRPSTALRRAQLDLLRTPEWSDPELWAGFVFIGDPAIQLGGDIEVEDTGGTQPARKAGSDMPPPKIAPDDDVPPPF
jgi:CHAT domain-containing protein/Tfp pilus assembly protein PilF